MIDQSPLVRYHERYKKIKQELGITPDIIMCRYENIEQKPTFIKKLSLFSNIPIERFFLAPNVDNIYKLPKKVSFL